MTVFQCKKGDFSHRERGEAFDKGDVSYELRPCFLDVKRGDHDRKRDDVAAKRAPRHECVRIAGPAANVVARPDGKGGVAQADCDLLPVAVRRLRAHGWAACIVQLAFLVLESCDQVMRRQASSWLAGWLGWAGLAAVGLRTCSSFIPTNCGFVGSDTKPLGKMAKPVRLKNARVTHPITSATIALGSHRDVASRRMAAPK